MQLYGHVLGLLVAACGRVDVIAVACALALAPFAGSATAQEDEPTCLYRDSLGNDFWSLPRSNCFEACEDAERTCKNVARLFPNEFGPNTPKGRALLQHPERVCYVHPRSKCEPLRLQR